VEAIIKTITEAEETNQVYGTELVEKKVKISGNSGRVYLPPNWIGHKVKIIRID
jgi:putative transposon-encoded protein